CSFEISRQCEVGFHWRDWFLHGRSLYLSFGGASQQGREGGGCVLRRGGSLGRAPRSLTGRRVPRADPSFFLVQRSCQSVGSSIPHPNRAYETEKVFWNEGCSPRRE